MPDANLESLVLASDMVGKAAIVLGVKIKVVVTGHATIVDAKDPEIGQRVNHIREPSVGDEVLVVKPIHEGHAVHGVQPDVGLGVQLGLKGCHGVAGAGTRRYKQPTEAWARLVSFRVQNTRNEGCGVPMPSGVLRHALQAIFGC